jgi:subtilisin family serine protease
VSEQPHWHREMLPQIADEVTFIVNAFAAAPGGGDIPLTHQGADIGVEAAGGGIDYLYAKRHLLVADQHLDAVLEVLGDPRPRWPEPGEGDGRGGQERPSQPAERGREDESAVADEAQEPGRDEVGVRRVIAGVVLLILPPALVDGDRGLSVPEWLDLIDRRLGRGAATPDQVLTVAPATSNCPATDPEPVYNGTEPYPPVCPPGTGAGTKIFLADTGLLPDAAAGHPWLDAVKPEDPATDLDPFVPGQTVTSQYIGHGTFVAGVARCLAPAAEITVTNAMAVAGSVLESALVPHLEHALAGGTDIFHLTIACATRHDLKLIGFGVWLGMLRETKGAVCVAAAGNSGGRRPSWPGAFPDVIAVGALAADWRSRASFSNYGGWVDVYAPGRDIVNAYLTGKYICQIAPYTNDERQFYGMAKWSGTSFSTPIVTGLIAARMSATGENARQAADALLAQARRQAIPGVGPILLPRCDQPCSCGGHERCAGRPDCAAGCRSRPCAC